MVSKRMLVYFKCKTCFLCYFFPQVWQYLIQWGISDLMCLLCVLD